MKIRSYNDLCGDDGVLTRDTEFLKKGSRMYQTGAPQVQYITSRAIGSVRNKDEKGRFSNPSYKKYKQPQDVRRRYRDKMRKRKGITVAVEDIEKEFDGIEVSTKLIMERYHITLKKASCYMGHIQRRARLRETEVEGYIRPEQIQEVVK